jgi:transposase-like protein
VYQNMDISSTLSVWLRKCSTLRCAVNQDRLVLDVLMHAQASEKSEKAPCVMITNKPNSYGAVRKDMGLRIGHHRHKGLNDRAERPYLPATSRFHATPS